MNVNIGLARAKWKKGNPSGAIRQLTTLFMQLQKLNEFAFMPAGIREADSLLVEIATYLVPAQGKDNAWLRPLSGDLIVATYLYTVGGHTSLIRDLAEALAAPPAGLWLTMHHPWGKPGLKAGALERTGLAERCREFECKDSWECAQQLVKSLADLRPARVFLVHHPYDCAAVIAAAAAKAMGSELVLLHHTDMRPSAGLFLPGVRIVDFTARASVFVQSILGLSSSYLPLTCSDPGRERRHFRSAGPLITGMSGNEHKIRAMLNPRYAELIGEVLSATRGTHVHIGLLSRELRKEITAVLVRKNLSMAAFRYIEYSESIPKALRANAVDLMINTYPSGGARTAVEVMAAGVPMIWHSSSAELDGVRGQMRYPLASIWRTVDDLKKILGNADPLWLQQQAESARSWYERQHHPRYWKDFFSGGELKKGAEIPSGIDVQSILCDILNRALDSNTGNLRNLISAALTRYPLLANFIRSLRR